MALTRVTAVACCCTLSVLLIFGIVSLATGFSTLTQTEYGLDHDTIQKRVSPKVYAAGLHWLGLGHEFIKFPATIQTIAFDVEHVDVLHARTKQGLPVILGATFQYRLMQEKLVDLYLNYTDKYEEVFFDTATQIITNTAANRTAPDFFNERLKIAFEMQNKLDAYFSSNLGAMVVGFQITEDLLPQAYSDAIVASMNKRQQITIAERNLENSKIYQTTRQLLAQTRAKTQVQKALGQAAAYQLEAHAMANATQVRATAEGKAYSKVIDGLNFGSNKTLLLQYMFWDSLASQQTASASCTDDACISKSQAQLMVGNVQGYVIPQK